MSVGGGQPVGKGLGTLGRCTQLLTASSTHNTPGGSWEQEEITFISPIL